MPHRSNFLLNLLTPAERDQLLPHLSVVDVGVRRTGVSDVVGNLQRAGMISCNRAQG